MLEEGEDQGGGVTATKKAIEEGLEDLLHISWTGAECTYALAVSEYKAGEDTGWMGGVLGDVEVKI